MPAHTRGTMDEAGGGRFCVEALNSHPAESIPPPVLTFMGRYRVAKLAGQSSVGVEV